MTGRTTIKCDFQSLGYDQTNPNLLQLVDRFHVFRYPFINGSDTKDIAGREGEKFLVRLPFRLETNQVAGVQPILQTVTMAVVAVKTNKQDFTVESQTFNIGASCMVNGQQSPNISGSRNYVTYSGDPFNSVTVKATSKYDSGTKKGYCFNYALTLRYDNWNVILPQIPGTNNCQNDISNDIPNPNNSWSSLVQNGWSLVLRCLWTVQGYDGYVTTYQAQTNINVQPMNSAPTIGPNYIPQTLYYDANHDSATYGQVVTGILPGSQTRVSMTFTPDGSPPDPYNAYAGYIFADCVTTGGVTARRIASTEVIPETGSPWSPAPQNGSPTLFYANGLSMNIYSSGVVIIEGIYDDTILNWAASGKKVITPGGIILTDVSLQTSTGRTIETAGGQQIGR